MTNPPMLLSCPKCQSTNRLQPITVSGGLETVLPLQARLTPPKEPGAWDLFRQPEAFPLRASVCADCGYVELYVQQPEALRARWEKGYR